MYSIGRKMIRISKLADYAVVILAEMGRGETVQMSTAVLAERVSIPEPTVSKILKILTNAKIVMSSRGVRGGYSLSRSVDDISVHDVIAAVDGRISVTSCAHGADTDCSIAHTCGTRGRWDQVNQVIMQALDNVSLRQMISENNVEKMKSLKYGRN